MGLRPRFTTPLTRARDTFVRYLVLVTLLVALLVSIIGLAKSSVTPTTTVGFRVFVAALDVQAARFKEKKLLRSERWVSKDQRMPVDHGAEEARKRLPPDTELILGRVVRLKRFQMKPMTEAEAIEQMEALGHDFFLFEDEDKGTLAVLYRREDGDYGMILPEPA